MTEAEVTKKIIDEVYSARERIYEETRHLTASEYVAHFSNQAQAIITRNGYMVVHSKDGLGYTIKKRHS